MAVIKPFGAHKCAHELRSAGFRTLVVNHINHFNPRELHDLISSTISNQTLLVGISNTFLPDFCRQQLTNISALVRQHHPNCKIVMGGAESNTVVNYPGIDYLVIGYADLSIVNLAHHLRRGVPLLKSYRSVYGYTVIEDAVAEGFDVHNSTMIWHDDDIVKGDRALPLEVSRGCIFRCAFCSHALNGKQNGDYIKRSDTLKDELLRNYHQYGIRTYRILDDTFNDNTEKLNQLELIASQLPFRLQLWAYIRLDLLTKHTETIDQLVRIGIRSMFFGIETFNKKTGRIIGKGYDPERQIETIRYIKNHYKNQVILHGHFIVGLPEESRESILRSIHRMRSGDIPLDIWYFAPLGIRKKNTSQWDSPFNVNLEKYGYTDTGQSLRSNLVHWKNAHMDFTQARLLSAQGGSARSGHQEFEIYALGYEFDDIQAGGSEFTTQNLSNTFNLHVNAYKRDLLNYVNDLKI